MKSLSYYKGTGIPSDNDTLRTRKINAFEDRFNTSAYTPSDSLVSAVNMAIFLSRPLLVTGEPGTGKTTLAYHVAHELGLDAPILFRTKSDSKAKDLFYAYDYMTRFHDSQLRVKNELVNYLSFTALGLAILKTLPKSQYAHLIADETDTDTPVRSLVLIDEIDKAEREFPNDILNELERMSFEIPEVAGAKFTADSSLAPIVIATSNSEKPLPPAFLRRCVFHYIEFPDRTTLETIVLRHLSKSISTEKPLISDAIDFLYLLRQDSSQLEKKPATAELLNWIEILHELFQADPKTLKEKNELVFPTLGLLTKTTEDNKRAEQLFYQWQSTSHE